MPRVSTHMKKKKEGRKTSLIPESDKFFRLSQNYGTPKIMAHPHNFHQTYGFIGHLVQTRMRSHLQRLGALWQHLRRLNGKTFQAMVQLILWMNHDKSMGSPRNMACTNFRPYNLGKMTVLKHGLWRFSQHSRSPTHGIPELLTSISGPGPG